MKILFLFSITITYGVFANIISNANPLPYQAIFNFGDSTSDTGNSAFDHPPMDKNSPYGPTYFKHPAGRLCNGRLIIDFIGFTSNKVEFLKACCGGGGTYNVNEKFCGMSGTTVCSDPTKQINWDGAHFTEAAYRQIAKGLVEGPFATPSLKPAPFKIA